MVVAASIRNQRSDDGLALLKRDNLLRIPISVEWKDRRSLAEKLFPFDKHGFLKALFCKAKLATVPRNLHRLHGQTLRDCSQSTGELEVAGACTINVLTVEQ